MARKGPDGSYDLAPFAACFPFDISAAEATALTAEHAYCSEHCPQASIGEGKMHAMNTMDMSCFKYQVDRLVGARIVYQVRRGSDGEWTTYAGRLDVVNDVLNIRLSEAFCGLPEVAQVNKVSYVPFPAVGYQYKYMVSAVVYMTFRYRHAMEQVQRLTQQLVATGGGAPVLGHDGNDGDVMAGYIPQAFNIWVPASYGPILAVSPATGMATIVARLDSACGYGSSHDPVLRSLFETAEKALIALARESSPFLTPWPVVVGSVLDRLRDHVTTKSGRDPHRARFEIAKESGFEGMDPFAAHVAQQRPKPRGKKGGATPKAEARSGNGAGAARKQ